jgi:hypothetical protein
MSRQCGVSRSFYVCSAMKATMRAATTVDLDQRSGVHASRKTSALSADLLGDSPSLA